MAQSNDLPLMSDEKSIYFNGVGLAVTAGDIVMALVRNNVPVATLNASYPVAKALAEGLTKMIADIEKASGQEVPKMQDLIKQLASLGGDPSTRS